MLLVTTLGLEMRLKFFQVDQRLEMLQVPLGTILARSRNAIEIFRSRPTFQTQTQTHLFKQDYRKSVTTYLSCAPVRRE